MKYNTIIFTNSSAQEISGKMQLIGVAVSLFGVIALSLGKLLEEGAAKAYTSLSPEMDDNMNRWQEAFQKEADK